MRGVKVYKNCFYIFHVYSPILIGAIIYTFFREDVLLIFRIYERLFFGEALLHTRDITMEWHVHPYILYTLPDFLWMYAFTCFLSSQWIHEEPSTWRTMFIITPLLLGAGGEIGQYFMPTLGTFDAVDLWSLLIAYVIAYTMTKLLVGKEGIKWKTMTKRKAV